MATKPASQGDDICPAGSRFTLDRTGAPIPGKCWMCGSGTVSLATSAVQVEGKVATSEDGMRIVLVGRGSPNAIQPFRSEDRSKGESSEECKGPGRCLGLARGEWEPGWGIFPVMLGQRNQSAFTFDRGMFRTLSKHVGIVHACTCSVCFQLLSELLPLCQSRQTQHHGGAGQLLNSF